MSKRKRVVLKDILPIIKAGAIGNPTTGDGRLIPVVIVDCDHHPQILDNISIHESVNSGDVICQWAIGTFNQRYTYLKVTFVKPMECSFHLEFDLFDNALLADGIIQSRAFYLQPKESGIKVSEGIDNPKLLIEVHPKTILPNWDRIIEKQLVKMFQKKHKMSKKDAFKEVEAKIKSQRKIWGLRSK